MLNTATDWLTAAAASYWSAARGGGRGGAGGARAVITAGVCWGCKVNVTLWETSASSASKSSIRRFVITEKAPTRAFSWLKAATTQAVTVSVCGSENVTIYQAK